MAVRVSGRRSKSLTWAATVVMSVAAIGLLVGS